MNSVMDSNLYNCLIFIYTQVFEWYREGVCGGGFYKFTACIMTADGTVCGFYDI